MRAFFRGRGVLRLRVPSLNGLHGYAFAPQSLLSIERLPGLVAAGGPNAPVTIHGRPCHSTLSLTVTDCHSLGIYKVILLSLLSFSVEMTVSPLATVHPVVRPFAPSFSERGSLAR